MVTSTIDTGPAGGHPAAGAPEAPRPLWRNLQFQLLWTGQSAATLGTSVADIAYPLAILALTGSPAQAGLFGAMQAAAAVVAGLPGGHLADRFDGRRIVVAAEAGRAAVTAGVVVALVEPALQGGCVYRRRTALFGTDQRMLHGDDFGLQFHQHAVERLLL